MTVGQLSEWLRTRLEPHFGSGETRALMRIIFEDVILLRPIDIIVSPEREIPDFITQKVKIISERLINNEPIQYILGHARFCGINLTVSPATLIPRPETAELIDIITDRYGHLRDLRILDLGTGSGCIAISLARALKFPQITAVDISDDALKIAGQNAADHRVKINFVEADILNLNIPGEFDIIVSNPPYVLDSERASMESHVIDHEPHSALFVPDSDPMRFYDAIMNYARRHAKSLYFEINPLCASRFEGAEIIKDSFGKNRFAVYDPFS